MKKILDERFYKHYSLEELENKMLAIINKSKKKGGLIWKTDWKSLETKRAWQH